MTDTKSKNENGAIVTTPEGPKVEQTEETEVNTGVVTIVVENPTGGEPGGESGGSGPIGGSGHGEGPGSGGGPGNGGGTGPGDGTDFPPSSGDSPKPQRVLKPVTFKIKARMVDDALVYSAGIKTKENLENASLIITTQCEEGEEAIDLVWANVGKVSHNTISGVNLRTGIMNEVKFRFEDNIKHLTSLVAYVTK